MKFSTEDEYDSEENDSESPERLLEGRKREFKNERPVFFDLECLMEDEYDSEAEAERIERLLKGRKCDLEFERPVKPLKMEKYKPEYIDESDFRKRRSPTELLRCLSPLSDMEEESILEGLCLEMMTKDGSEFGRPKSPTGIVDDISVTELSPQTSPASKKCKVGQHESPVKKVGLRRSKRIHANKARTMTCPISN